MSKISDKIRKAIVALLWPTIFFFISLNLVVLFRVLMLQGSGIPISTPVQTAVGALILGITVLVTDRLPGINRFPDKPLVYNVAWKTTIYILGALLIHYVTELVGFWREAGSFVAGNQKLLAEIVWPHFWAIQIILAILIFSYCVLHELARVIGVGNVRAMFFRRPTNTRD